MSKSDRKDLSKKHTDIKHEDKKSKEVKKEEKKKESKSKKSSSHSITPAAPLTAKNDGSVVDSKVLTLHEDQKQLDRDLTETFSVEYLKEQQKFSLNLEAKLNAAVEGKLSVIPGFVAKQVVKESVDAGTQANLSK